MNFYTSVALAFLAIAGLANSNGVCYVGLRVPIAEYGGESVITPNDPTNPDAFVPGSIDVEITHSWIGDVSLRLESTSPSQSFELASPLGGTDLCSPAEEEHAITFFPQAGFQDISVCPGERFAGSYTSLQDFSTASPSANWYLVASDSYPALSGTVDSLCIYGSTRPTSGPTPAPTPFPTNIATQTFCYSGAAIAFGDQNSPLHVTTDTLPSSFVPRFVEVQLTHTYVGDVSLTLESVNSFQYFTLVSRIGGDNCKPNVDKQSLGFVAGFASPTVECDPNGIVGHFTPQNRFNNANGASDWRLVVTDSASLDDGTIDKFCLWNTVPTFTYAPTPTPTPAPPAPPTPSPTPQPPTPFQPTPQPPTPLGPTPYPPTQGPTPQPTPFSPPGPVENLRQVDSTEHSVTFAWDPPLTGSLVENWRIHYREGSPGDKVNKPWPSSFAVWDVRVDPATFTVTLSGLAHASTGVQINIKGQNLAGLSSRGRAVGYTDGSPPPHPANLRVVSNEPTSLHVVWDAPPMTPYPTGWFEVSFRTRGEFFSRKTRIYDDKNEYVITGLEPSTDYQILVTALNVAGRSSGYPLPKFWASTA